MHLGSAWLVLYVIVKIGNVVFTADWIQLRMLQLSCLMTSSALLVCTVSAVAVARAAAAAPAAAVAAAHKQAVARRSVSPSLRQHHRFIL